MKVPTSLLTTVALPLLAVAHGDDYLQARHHHARQAPSSSRLPGPSSSGAPPASGTLPSSIASGSVTASPTSTQPNITISLLSTNPTALPLSSIVANQSSGTTLALSTTAAPGSVPTYMSAPPLPNVANWNPANYPPLDKVPPTDSPQVQQWIQEVADTGIIIPDLSPTNPGGCPNNTDIVANTTRCWWTCGGCVAPFDITQCPTPMTWGLTYDDGPGFYTTELLAYLAANGLRSTFFQVGSRVSEFPYIAQAEYMAGNQIAVHTWSHPYMTTLTTPQVIAELGWSKKVIKDALGVTPGYWRPPFGDVDQRVRAIAVAMGLTPILWTRISASATFDTGDFNIASNTTSSFQVIQNWEYILGNVTTMKTGFIVLEHDLFQQAVDIAVGYILPDALAFNPKFNITPVISCLNMPMSNAYIETNDNATNIPLISGSYVTTVQPSATGVGGLPGSVSHSGGAVGLTMEFSLMFVTTAVTLLAGVYAVRF